MGAFSGVITVFILIAVVLSFLMPFFVLRIRNELISMNKELSKLIELFLLLSSCRQNSMFPIWSKCFLRSANFEIDCLIAAFIKLNYDMRNGFRVRFYMASLKNPLAYL